MSEHPYNRYMRLKAWKVIENALSQLEENNDLERKTAPEYIIGFLIKSLEEKTLLKKEPSQLEE